MRTRHAPIRHGFLAMVLIVLPWAGTAAWSAAAAPAATAGVWQMHRLQFNYLGAGTHYSCAGLHDVFGVLLRQLGARPDARIEPHGCLPRYSTPSRTAYLTLQFATLAPAAQASAAASATVPGAWRHVLLAPHRPFELGIGDCELIDEFRLKVLPQFTTRDVTGNLHCVPFQASQWSLDLQVFAPLPAGGAVPH